MPGGGKGKHCAIVMRVIPEHLLLSVCRTLLILEVRTDYIILACVRKHIVSETIVIVSKVNFNPPSNLIMIKMKS